MAKVHLIATGKKYGTRHMTAGAPMSVKPAEARVLKALGVAVDAPDGAAKVKAKPKVEAKAEPKTDLHPLDHEEGGPTRQETTDEMTALRAEYFEKIGRRPFPGWDAGELRRRMAEAAEATE
jgi:hypothetical protein